MHRFASRTLATKALPKDGAVTVDASCGVAYCAPIATRQAGESSTAVVFGSELLSK